jgi:subtilase family serine protease
MKNTLTALLLLATAAMHGNAAAEPRTYPPQGIRPDLDITYVFLRASAGGPAVTSVRTSRAYWVCYTVRNIGAAPSGGFRVSASGVLGAQHHDHAGLAVNASRQRCFYDATGPSTPGNYPAFLLADSQQAVQETSESNNTETFNVTIAPSLPHW